ncbi:MAG: SLC13 family permease [Planctomycetota bacterium]
MDAPLWHAWMTGGVILAATGSMLVWRAPTDAALLIALTALLALGVVDVAQAASGFADPAVLLIGALFIVAQGLRDGGALRWAARALAGSEKPSRAWNPGGPAAQGAVAVASAILNNTAVVALSLPIVREAARRRGISPSRVLMGLSFAAILGGTCTLIGTSTNIVVNELWVESVRAAGEAEPSAARQFWWMAPVAVPAALAGLAFIALAGGKLVPLRRAPDELGPESDSDTGPAVERSYAIAVRVTPEFDAIGKTIHDAGLRRAAGLFLSAIDRAREDSSERQRIVAPASDELVREGDRLVFTGDVAAVADLLRRPGLRPDEDHDEPSASARRSAVVEAVIPDSSDLVGQTVRDSRFRTRFDAAIVAVHRGGERVPGRVGDVRLRPGDTLLLWTHAGFVDAHRESRRLLVVTSDDGGAGRTGAAWRAVAVLAVLVVLMGAPLGAPKLAAAWICAALMVLLRCVTVASARTAIPWSVLLTIAAALGLGQAAEASGLAQMTAGVLIDLAGNGGGYGLLIAVALATVVATQLVTNQAAAVLIFPIALAAAHSAGLNPEPFVVTLMVMASASFLTPTGYATNLMVYGPGGYRFGDFARLGAPLTLIVGAVCVALAPRVYPF